jgi:hypothetical protein
LYFAELYWLDYGCGGVLSTLQLMMSEASMSFPLVMPTHIVFNSEFSSSPMGYLGSDLLPVEIYHTPRLVDHPEAQYLMLLRGCRNRSS